jgi:hypothetical protein
MPRLTEAQIKAARAVDLLSFLTAQNPSELIRTGTGEWRTVAHGSLVITKGHWYWNRGGVGGRTAIDYLVKVQGMDFIEAVREVLSTGIATEPLDIPMTRRATTRTEPKRPVFKLSSRAENNDNLTRYLLARGISRTVIDRCIAEGILYEGRYLCSPVCVFVGHGEDGQARFATIRGTVTGIKRDVAGSDKAYSFHFKAQNSNSRVLFVFESPIDALSHLTLGELHGWEQGAWRLSLAGTSHMALEAFLSRHPTITRVILHMDSDAAGVAGALRIKTRMGTDERFRHIRVSVRPARGGKDFNDRLMREQELTETDNDRTKEGGYGHARRDQREVGDACGACRGDGRCGVEARCRYAACTDDGRCETDDKRDTGQHQRRRHQTRQTDDGTARQTQRGAVEH